jgi:hypothetical protein
MVGMVATLVITARFIISVAILAVLAWRIVMVLAIILIAPLVRPITVSVFVVSVSMVNVIGGCVSVLTARLLGHIVFFGLLLSLHDLGKYAAAHISIVAALKEL